MNALAVPDRNPGEEIEGGVHLADLPEGTCLEVETENHLYSIMKAGGGVVSISGHPRYCPYPVEVELDYVGRGMRLEFWHPAHDLVSTSRICGIRQTV